MTDGNETSDFNHEKEEMVMLLIVEVYSLKWDLNAHRSRENNFYYWTISYGLTKYSKEETRCFKVLSLNTTC
jgi:hypothetical protein